MPLRDIPARRNLRLPGWDYRSPGHYAITLATQNREWFFGEVHEGKMALNAAGQMVVAIWQEMDDAFPRIAQDAFVVMPNHLHAIVHLSRDGPAGNPRLGDIVQRFKSVTTAEYSKGVRLHNWAPYDRRLWQQEYYDHIVRDQHDLDRCRRYIAANPANWATDCDREPLRTPTADANRM